MVTGDPAGGCDNCTSAFIGNALKSTDADGTLWQYVNGSECRLRAWVSGQDVLSTTQSPSWVSAWIRSSGRHQRRVTDFASRLALRLLYLASRALLIHSAWSRFGCAAHSAGKLWQVPLLYVSSCHQYARRLKSQTHSSSRANLLVLLAPTESSRAAFVLICDTSPRRSVPKCSVTETTSASATGLATLLLLGKRAAGPSTSRCSVLLSQEPTWFDTCSLKLCFERAYEINSVENRVVDRFALQTGRSHGCGWYDEQYLAARMSIGDFHPPD